MAKTITLNFEGVTYTLEFTRNSIAKLERQGFNINDVLHKPVTTLPLLFAGAFLAHHRFVKQDVTDKIYDKLKNKEELLGKLGEMYNETLETLLRDPEDTEGAEGNVEWGANW